MYIFGAVVQDACMVMVSHLSNFASHTNFTYVLDKHIVTYIICAWLHCHRTYIARM